MQAGDEVAFFRRDRRVKLIHVEVREAAFDPWQMLSQWQATQAANTRSGATAVFVGTMRDFNEAMMLPGCF